MNEHRSTSNRDFLSDCARIHQQWHDRAKSCDTEGLLALYAVDAVLETPLAQAIHDGRDSGVLRGHREIRPFFEEGARRRPMHWCVGTGLAGGSPTANASLSGNIPVKRRTAIRSILSR